MVELVNNPETYYYPDTAYIRAGSRTLDDNELPVYPVLQNEQRIRTEQPATIDIDLDAPGISFSSIAQYLRELRRATHLPPAAEQQVVEQARCGDQAARHRLIEDRLPYIVHMATRYHVYAEHEDLLDIVGAANLAVTANIDKALVKENPAAYLCGVAKREIRTYCFYHSRLMPIKDHRMPQSEVPAVMSLDELHEDLVHRYLGALAHGGTFEDSNVRRRQIHQALGQLAEQERQVVELRHGVNSQAHTFTDIARLLDTSPSVVSRRYYRAIAQLRDMVSVPEQR